MATIENEIVQVKNQDLALFGDRADIREMFERIKTMVPGAAKAPTEVVMMAAQKAIAHGLDLFDDELYLMEVKGRWTAHVGIRGLRRLADGKFMFEESDEYPRTLTDEEMRADMGKEFKPGTFGVEVRLYNLPKARTCKAAGIPYFPRRERGYWWPSDSVPATRTPAWVAQKRAEKMALRAEFSLDFRGQASAAETVEAVEWKLEQIDRDGELPVNVTYDCDDDGQILLASSRRTVAPKPRVEFVVAPQDDEPFPLPEPPAESAPEPMPTTDYAAVYDKTEGNDRLFVEFCRRKHRADGGPATQPMYHYLVGVIDDLCNDNPRGHTAVLEVLTGAKIDQRNPPSYALAKWLLDHLTETRTVDEVKVANPQYRPDLAQIVTRLWNLCLEAEGQLRLLDA